MTSGPFSAIAHSRPTDRSTMNAPSRPRVSILIAPASSSRPIAAWIDDRLEPWSWASSRIVGSRDGGSGAVSNRRASSVTTSVTALAWMRACVVTTDAG